MAKSAATAPSTATIRAFTTRKEWAAWLAKHHESSPGIWLRIARTGSGVVSVTHPEALEEALRYGWIDGLKKSHDARTWLQKFSPRGERSIWSRINREKAEALMREGRMRRAGLAAVERAKRNGRWEKAYESQKSIGVPADLQAALDANRKAKAFFETLDSRNRYAILFRTDTARKPETRARRIRQFVEMLARREKIYS